MPMFLDIKSPKNECRRFFSTFANFEKNKNRQTFWTCISKTTHPKVSFGKIKCNLIFWFCPAILDPYWHSLLTCKRTPYVQNFLFNLQIIFLIVLFSIYTTYFYTFLT